MRTTRGQGERNKPAARATAASGERNNPGHGTPRGATGAAGCLGWWRGAIIPGRRPSAETAAFTIPRTRPGRAGPIDIIFLVERLESVIASGKKLPLTSNVVVDQAAALDLIDQLRVAVPEEVRAAKRINSEGERIIEKAQEESEQVIARAQEQAAFLIEERGLLLAAQEESVRIIDNAELDAQEVRRGADEYAAAVLIGLEGDVVRTLQSIKKGIQLLDERRAAFRSDEGLPGEAFDDEDQQEVAPSRARS